MSCQRLTRQARPAPLWHRARCPECRAARRADATLAFALACRRAERAPAAGLARTLAALDLPHALPYTRRARLAAIARRCVRPAIACAIALAAGGWGWLWWIDRDPNVAVPPPRVPATNGFSLFQSAGQSVVQSKAIDNGANAALSPGDRSPGTHVFTLKEKEGIVRDNAAALDYLAKGLKLDYAAPPVRSASDSFGYVSDDRRLARLLAVRARTEADRGKWDDSAATSLQAIEFGIRIQKGGVIINRLSGIACETIGRRELWAAVGHLDATQARAAAARLAAVSSGREPLAATIEQEKWYGVAILQQAMRAPGWRHSLAGTLTDGTGDSPSANWAAYFASLRYSKRRIVANWIGAMVNEEALASGPYVARATDVPTVEATGDPISSFLLPAMSNLRLRDTDDATQNALLAIALALRAYRLEHGAYPPTLDALTPHRLVHAFADPFGAGQWLRYRRKGDSYVLYSIGPDGEDNGGKALVTPGEQPQSSRQNIQQNSVGDIVAGVDID